MSVTPENVPTSAPTKTAPASQTQPAPKPAKRVPTGFSSDAALAGMARTIKAEEQQYAPQIQAADERMANDQALLQSYQGELGHTWEMMQRQRIITVNRAQVLRKMMPIIGLMALLAGHADGVTGATAALAGAFAGLNKGEELQFQRAWKEYGIQYNRMMAHANMLREQIKSVLEDNSKTMSQKIDMVKALSAGVAMFDRTAIEHNDRQAGLQTNEHDKLYWYGQQLDEFNRKLAKTSDAKKRADIAMNSASQSDITDVMDTLMPNGVPFTPPKGDVQHLGKPTPAQINAAKHAAEVRWHNTFAQVAIIAKHYMYTHPHVNKQQAIQTVGDSLRAQGLLKGPSEHIPTHLIETELGAAGSDSVIYVGKGTDGKERKITGADLRAKAEMEGVPVAEIIQMYNLHPEK